MNKDELTNVLPVFLSGRSVRSLWTWCPRTAPRWAAVGPPPAWSPASRAASPTSACSPTASGPPPSAPPSPPSRATWWRPSKCWRKEREGERATTKRRWSTANRGRTVMEDERRKGREKEGRKTDHYPLWVFTFALRKKNWDFDLPEEPLRAPGRGGGGLDDICTVMCVTSLNTAHGPLFSVAGLCHGGVYKTPLQDEFLHLAVFISPPPFFGKHVYVLEALAFISHTHTHSNTFFWTELIWEVS